ncbi:MAG: hypothetical protein ABIN97_10310, partial [Ginsengibacter sp.]
MDKLIKPGRIIFAIGIIGLGILCIISKDFIIGRPPTWPAGFNVNPELAYISGTAMIIAALAVLFNKKAELAALVIAALIFLLSVLRHLPHFMNDWGNAYKSMALFGGALIIFSSFYMEDATGNLRISVNENLKKGLVLTGCILLAAFFVACGYAHFKFALFVKDFIPAYIPFHTFWAYFCGICFFAGGAGLLIPQTRRWAALLSGIMVLGWFILLHIPRFIANPNDASDRMGLFESFTFAGIFFV